MDSNDSDIDLEVTRIFQTNDNNQDYQTSVNNDNISNLFGTLNLNETSSSTIRYISDVDGHSESDSTHRRRIEQIRRRLYKSSNGGDSSSYETTNMPPDHIIIKPITTKTARWKKLRLKIREQEERRRNMRRREQRRGLEDSSSSYELESRPNLLFPCENAKKDLRFSCFNTLSLMSQNDLPAISYRQLKDRNNRKRLRSRRPRNRKQSSSNMSPRMVLESDNSNDVTNNQFTPNTEHECSSDS